MLVNGTQPATAFELPSPPATLDEILSDIWASLARGVRDRHAAAHTPAIATVDATGDPQVRTVVLRRCDPADRRLHIHTDARSPKAAELALIPRAVLHVYDRKAKTQVRLRCSATLHREDAVSASAWERTRPFSRVCYQVTTAPGQILADPGAVAFSPEDTDDGADHFLLVELVAEKIDWLYLDHRGHRRARFRWNDGWNGTWVVP